jgi:cytochrome c553
MLHVDEGRLSEYLDRPIDGSSDRAEIEAHLAECAECRERLAELRAVKARADALLRHATPASMAMPGFEEIEARARARRGAGPRRVLSLHRLTALGWAATIVLAVGIGWIARGAVMREAGNAPVPLDGAPSAAIGGMAAPAESSAARRGAAELSEERSGAEPAGRLGAVADQTPQLAAAPPAPVELRQQANEAAPQPTAGAVPEGEQPSAKAEAAEGVRTRQAVSGVVAIADERRNAAARGEMPADSLAPAAIAQLAAHAVESPAWTGATAEDAERHLGGPLRVVEGLPVESTSVGAVDGTPAVRVVQLLPGGEQIEIVQWQSDSTDADASRRGAVQKRDTAPEAARRMDEIVIVRDGVIAVVRGPVPADSLAALARKIP